MATTLKRQRLGKRLRKLRADRGWTLAQLSEVSGLDKAVLSRLERGERAPTLETLRKLRDAYQVDDDTFLSWVDAA